jgi:hypothetical protein
MCLLPTVVILRASAQDAAKAEKKIPVENVPATTNASTENEDVVVLSPFSVNTDKDKGYFSENTLAGSRMKTKLSDLGASISIVNKAEMEDFASTDINDVFRYEVNTEGSNTYTPIINTSKNDGLVDVNAGGTTGGSVSNFTNAGANRVRGLGVPSAAINYYPSIGGIPADSYNTSSFEISRGPNSMLFGVGSPAGVVNQSTQQALLTKNLNRVSVSIDDRGSYRVSLGFNRMLLPNKLAFYGAMLFDEKRFERKPSYDNTRRLYAALTYKPFAKTVIKANFEDYNNNNRRPNSLSPTDLITQWNLAGRPTYDALTKSFTYLSTGVVQGPYISSGSNTLNDGANAAAVRNYVTSLPNYNPALRGAPATAGNLATFTTYNGAPIFGGAGAAQATTIGGVFYVPGVTEIYTGRTQQQIANGQVQNWYQPLYLTSYRSAYNIPGAGGTSLTPLSDAPISNMWNSALNSDIYNRDSFQSAGWTNNQAVTNVGNYRYPSVTDRSIYDWKKVNLTEMNFGWLKNRNYNAEIEQEILENLFLSAGWFRQDMKQSSNYTTGQQYAPAVTVDINKYLPNGTPNPYFGLPFVNERDPDQYVLTEVDDHFRAMLAYTPDFTKKDGWIKWLGHHQLLGMWSRDESMASATRKRLFFVGADTPAAAYRYIPNPTNNADGTRTGWSYQPSNSGALERKFYLANPGDTMGKVTRSSGEWNAESYSGNIQVFNYATGAFENAGVTQAFTTFDAPQRTEKILQSLNTGLTSYFWKDRLVTTFGARLDKFHARQTTTGAITRDDGSVDPTMTAQQKFTADGFFDTNSVWNRFNKWYRITGRTKTGGGVFRPFSGWSSIDKRADNGNQFWQVVQNFGISYNWSNNFNTPLGPENDAFGKMLAKPYGVGHDLGFQFSALDGKLFARVTWFQATNINQRNTSGTAGTAFSRLDTNIDTTMFRGWARTIAVINKNDPLRSNPTINGFDAAWTPAEEQQIQADTAVIWKQAYTYYNDLPGSITTTGDAKSKGLEVQVNYNTGNWRNRVTFGKQDTINSNVLKQFDAWYAQRMPIMLDAKAADFLTPAAVARYTQPDGSIAYHSYQDTSPQPNVNLTNFWSSYGYNSAVKYNNSDGNTNVANYYNNVVTPFVMLAKDQNGQAAPNQRKYHGAFNTGYDFSTRWIKGFGVGAAERWESKSVIGYYGRSSHSNTTTPNLLDLSDVSRPIYDKANYYTDLFVKYQHKVWSDRIAWTLQLNVENVFENGHLQTVAVNYDGTPYGYRIIDSRKFTLTSTFEF